MYNVSIIHKYRHLRQYHHNKIISFLVSSFTISYLHVGSPSLRGILEKGWVRGLDLAPGKLARAPAGAAAPAPRFPSQWCRPFIFRYNSSGGLLLKLHLSVVCIMQFHCISHTTYFYFGQVGALAVKKMLFFCCISRHQWIQFRGIRGKD
jgi:hypothetical protein